jgi:hypothetical protein
LAIPTLINKDYSAKFIDSRQGKGWFGHVTRQSQQEMESCKGLVNMVTELRFAMGVFAKQAVLVDTGQYQAKYQTEHSLIWKTKSAETLHSSRIFKQR